jgi:hypothetical protein
MEKDGDGNRMGKRGWEEEEKGRGKIAVKGIREGRKDGKKKR